MRVRLARYREAGDARVDYTIGCVLLEQPFFLEEHDWIPAPADWSGNIVRGKGYDSTVGEGRKRVAAERYGAGTIVYPRLGQGTFRVLVTGERAA